ncbi:IclR family transcriptional regulator domain-containing protein [Marivita geojedonensis]|uniref:IclR family transcriptional regulator n=1 Tax=Marivita geojedonensis TaxID=1123756 RepID=A0A1X4NRB0_9RHOB|nr:IclR family transcriptional regulator C-terminal domain-containing protein [Marivita geojedonensis]OSQ53460.1 IclR family transcriptional regulator [Marivita geojedonensis]PRY81550.1 IclR family transcriptional regulator [Marivita geojedonensis]
MTQTTEKPAEFVEALAKGIAILESFDADNPEMTLSEVARRVGLSPAAARRSLMTLETLGYIGRKEKRFHLKPKLMALGSAFYFTARVDEILQEDLRSIVERFGDASSVGTLDGGDVIYVAHHSVQRARRAAAVAGARYPAYATSMGRVLLAALNDDELDQYLNEVQPQKLTSKTCTNTKALRAELMVARRDGYATTVDQLDYGITALAVPIRDAKGKTIAALNTSGYTGLTSPETLVAERLPALQEAASHIAHQLTRYPTLRSALGG